MASDVKWIKMMVGMFDGMSFKKIKRAKIGGESFRDKLTAVWFELMDFAGKCNHEGALVSPAEIPFTDLSDIATMIDRETEELQLCMNFFINEGMVTVVNDIYSLSNWMAYQNKEGLDKIREQTRKRVAKHRDEKKLLEPNTDVTHCNANGNVTVTHCNALDKDIRIKNKKEDKRVKEDAHALFARLKPDYTISDAVADKLTDWLSYKEERTEHYKEQGLKALLRQVVNACLTYGDNAVLDAIDTSMANGWKGIIYDRLKNPQGKPSGGYQRQTKAEELDEFYRMAEEWANT